MEKITILLADDHTVVREGLRALLSAQGDILVIGEAATGRAAVAMARERRPDVAVVDMAMPVLNGLEATRQIRREAPFTKVLVLSSYSDDEYVIELIEAGALGYLVKQTAGHDLIQAIREVNKGNTFFSPSISKRLLERYCANFQPGSPIKRTRILLTSREREVLQLIAEGKATKEIAAALCLSIKTIDKHRQRVMSKLDIHEIAGLTRYAISKGIIETLRMQPLEFS